MKEQNIKSTFCQESQEQNKFGCGVVYRLGGLAGDTEPVPSSVVTKRPLFGCESSPISRNVRSSVSQSVSESVLKCKERPIKAQ